MLQAENIENTYQKFSQEYDALKGAEHWKEIISLGLRALEDHKVTNEDSSTIKCRLASCYYYLGEYKETLKSAKDALDSATQAGNNELKVRSLYLISATYRALIHSAAEEQIRENYKGYARSYIEDAKLLLKSNVSDFTKAKVYFNAGALEHELNNIDLALEYYSSAKNLFKAGGDDYNRTVIRYIRASAEGKKRSLDGLISEAKTLNISQETKTSVHFALLMSKLLVKCGKVDDALIYAKDGLEITKMKTMPSEVKMLEKLICGLEKSQSKAEDQAEIPKTSLSDPKVNTTSQQRCN